MDKTSPILSQAMLDAQTAVLGSMLIDPATVGPVMARTAAKDFNSPQHRVIYEACRKLFEAGKAVDSIAVNEMVGGNATDFLIQLMDLTPTAANCDEYIALLRRSAALSRLRQLGEDLSGAADLDAARALVEQAGVLLSERSELRIVSVAQGLREFIDRHSNTYKPDYLPWDFGLSDYLYVEGGDLVVIGARPSVGKTTFGLVEAFEQARTRRVGFFSLETRDQKLIDRLVASRADISFGSIKRHTLTDQDCANVVGLCDSWAKVGLEIIPMANARTSDLRAVALSRRYDVIYVDYLQLLSPSGGVRPSASTFERVTQVSKELHGFSQDTGTTVICLSQLSRGEKLKGGKELPPRLSDLRESGQIEQDADVVLLLFKEFPNAKDSKRILHLAKNKEGLSGGYQMLDFDGDKQSFRRSMKIYKPAEPEKKDKQLNLFRPEPEDPNAPF